MAIEKIDNFSRGYRKGVHFALRQLLKEFGEEKLLQID